MRCLGNPTLTLLVCHTWPAVIRQLNAATDPQVNSTQLYEWFSLALVPTSAGLNNGWSCSSRQRTDKSCFTSQLQTLIKWQQHFQGLLCVTRKIENIEKEYWMWTWRLQFQIQIWMYNLKLNLQTLINILVFSLPLAHQQCFIHNELKVWCYVLCCDVCSTSYICILISLMLFARSAELTNWTRSDRIQKMERYVL